MEVRGVDKLAIEEMKEMQKDARNDVAKAKEKVAEAETELKRVKLTLSRHLDENSSSSNNKRQRKSPPEARILFVDDDDDSNGSKSDDDDFSTTAAANGALSYSSSGSSYRKVRNNTSADRRGSDGEAIEIPSDDSDSGSDSGVFE